MEAPKNPDDDQSYAFSIVTKISGYAMEVQFPRIIKVRKQYRQRRNRMLQYKVMGQTLAFVRSRYRDLPSLSWPESRDGEGGAAGCSHHQQSLVAIWYVGSPESMSKFQVDTLESTTGRKSPAVSRFFSARHSARPQSSGYAMSAVIAQRNVSRPPSSRLKGKPQQQQAPNAPSI